VLVFAKIGMKEVELYLASGAIEHERVAVETKSLEYHNSRVLGIFNNLQLLMM
jgi:hypothetical protein